MSKFQCCLATAHKLTFLTIKDQILQAPVSITTPYGTSPFVDARKIGKFIVLQSAQKVSFFNLESKKFAKHQMWRHDDEKIHLVPGGILSRRPCTWTKYKICKQGELTKEWTLFQESKSERRKKPSIGPSHIPLKYDDKKSTEISYTTIVKEDIQSCIRNKTILSTRNSELIVKIRSGHNSQNLVIRSTETPDKPKVISLSDKLGRYTVLDMRLCLSDSRFHLGLLIKQDDDIFFVLYRTSNLEKIA